MTMGGEPAEARQPGGPPVVKVEDEDRPLVGGDSVVPPRDDVEKSLARFAEAAASSPNAPPKIPMELESVLREISIVGVPYYGWGALKELLAIKMTEAVGALEKESGFYRANDGKEYAQRRDELVAGLRKFEAAPFTLQRLAEVLQDPRRQYTRTHKLINGLERLLAVSSTLPVRPRKGVVRGEGGHVSVNNGSILAAAATVTMAKASLRGISTGVTSDGSNNGGSGNAVAVTVEELGGAAQVPVDEGKLMGQGGFTKGWESREGKGDAGQGTGRKRLKVDRTQEPQVMSE